MVPKKRHTKSRRNRRRSHHSLKKSKTIKCSKCGDFVIPHKMCNSCGYYKDNQIIDIAAKLDKKQKKKLEKMQKEQEKEKQAQGKTKSLSLEELSKK